MISGEPLYVLRVRADDRPEIMCGLCGAVSLLAGDIEQRYCARCHLFHEVVAEGRRLHNQGSTHDCAEWRTGRNRCAICDADLAGATAGPVQ